MEMTLSYLTSDTRQSGGIWWPRRRQCNVYENARFYRGYQNINYSSLLYVRYTKLGPEFTGNVPVLALLLVFQIILVKSRIINCSTSSFSTFTDVALNSGSKHPRLFHVFFSYRIKRTCVIISEACCPLLVKCTTEFP